MTSKSTTIQWKNILLINASNVETRWQTSNCHVYYAFFSPRRPPKYALFPISVEFATKIHVRDDREFCDVAGGIFSFQNGNSRWPWSWLQICAIWSYQFLTYLLSHRPSEPIIIFVIYILWSCCLSFSTFYLQ